MTAMETVDLVELTEAAAYQTRRDRKYLVPVARLDELVAAMPPARVLAVDSSTSFPYESVYFDTADLRSYSDAAKRRPRRFKVRTRAYLSSDDCMLEVKARNARGQTVKQRAPHPLDLRHDITPDAAAFVRSIEEASVHADELRPTLVTTYRRSTYLLDDLSARVTVDVDLRWSTPDGDGLDVPDLAIIETKTAGHPSNYDRVLWRLGFRPSTVSKYCTGLAALRPLLPANKWHRVLSRELGEGAR